MKGHLSACLGYSLVVLLTVAVAPARAVSIVPDSNEPAPQKKVDFELDTTLASVGLAAGQKLIPGGKQVALIWSAVGPLKGALGNAIEHRDQLERSNLKVIDSRIQRLEEINDEGRVLATDPEAQQLLKEFRQSSSDIYDGRTSGLQFAGKAVFSLYGGYTLTRHAAEWGIGRWLGGRMADWLDWDEPTQLAWKRQGVLKNVFTRTSWRSLKKVAQYGGDLQNRILKSIMRMLLVKLLHVTTDETIEKKFNEILDRHKELEQDLAGGYGGGGGGSYVDLRVDALNIPGLYFPVLEAVPTAAAPQPAAQAPLPLAAVPPQIAVAADPVMAPIAVQTQVLISQPTTFRGGGYEPPDRPTREEPPTETPPPPEEPPHEEPEPPSHPLPPFKPPCSSSFDGNTISRVCG